MRRIVTHKSCDIDAISSVWLLKRFYPNWDGAEVDFVNAGEKLPGVYGNENQPIEIVDGVETIHVDTGLGALDHHQTDDNNTCGAARTLDFVLENHESSLHTHETKKEAVKRIVELVIDDDHFQEVYYPDSSHDIYELGVVAIIQGYKLLHQKDDKMLVEFIFECLDSVLHNLEKKIWAEREIKEKGVEFESKWGRALGVESINDEVLKLAQMMGYKVVVRKDQNEGFVRIKAMPDKRIKNNELRIKNEKEDVIASVRDGMQIPSPLVGKQSILDKQSDHPALGGGSSVSNHQKLNIDLTQAYVKLKELDPEATWFLHASKRMLLNGSSKNPEMKGTILTLEQVIDVLKQK